MQKVGEREAKVSGQNFMSALYYDTMHTAKQPRARFFLYRSAASVAAGPSLYRSEERGQSALLKHDSTVGLFYSAGCTVDACLIGRHKCTITLSGRYDYASIPSLPQKSTAAAGSWTSAATREDSPVQLWVRGDGQHQGYSLLLYFGPCAILPELTFLLNSARGFCPA